MQRDGQVDAFEIGPERDVRFESIHMVQKGGMQEDDAMVMAGAGTVSRRARRRGSCTISRRRKIEILLSPNNKMQCVCR